MTDMKSQVERWIELVDQRPNLESEWRNGLRKLSRG